MTLSLLASRGNMNQTKTRALVEGGRLRRAVAGELQHLEEPRSWMGPEGVNIFRPAAAVNERGGTLGRFHCQPPPRQWARPR